MFVLLVTLFWFGKQGRSLVAPFGRRSRGALLHPLAVPADPALGNGAESSRD